VTLKQLPNAITLLRFLLVPLFAVAIAYGQFGTALLIFFIAAVSDALDGFLARILNAITPLGKILDPLADKLLLASAYISLALLELLPIWLMVAVIGRDLIILSGAVIYRQLYGNIEIHPTLISKLNTLLQLVLVLEILINAWRGDLIGIWRDITLWLVVITTTASGFDYIWQWGRKAWQQQRELDHG
jgi:cardiolipin synthase (CMP-forming)